jgi:LCP family protein required for cell wall assembly
MTADRRTRWLRGVAGAGAAVVLALAALTASSPVAKALRRGDFLTGVVMGTDLAENTPHTDTLLMLMYHPRESRLDVISIPRDTKIDLPGYRFGRINEVFAYHYAQTRDPAKAADETRAAVGRLFSAAGVDLTPAYFLHVDYGGFRNVIDALGGVSLAVGEPMDYDDQAGNFHVHLATGLQRLDGERALGYVRYRGRSGDRGRIHRQMDFLRTLAAPLRSPQILWRGPRALAAAWGSWRSNLRPWEWAALALEARRLKSSGINTLLLPGSPRGAAWEMDPGRTAYVLGRLENSAPAAPVSPETAAPSAAESPARVKVWNASERKGLALEVVRFLRARGFDVVEWGNYNGRQARSRVVDRSGRFDRAREVAGALGVASLYSDVDPALRTDVDVVLGQDFSFPVGKATEVP